MHLLSNPLWHQGLSECVSNFNIYCVDTHVCLLHVFLVFFEVFLSLASKCKWNDTFLFSYLGFPYSKGGLQIDRIQFFYFGLNLTTSDLWGTLGWYLTFWSQPRTLCDYAPYFSLPYFFKGEDKTFLDFWKLKAASFFFVKCGSQLSCRPKSIKPGKNTRQLPNLKSRSSPVCVLMTLNKTSMVRIMWCMWTLLSWGNVLCWTQSYPHLKELRVLQSSCVNPDSRPRGSSGPSHRSITVFECSYLALIFWITLQLVA